MLIFRTINYDAQMIVYFGSAAKQRQYRRDRPDSNLEESRFDLSYKHQIIQFLNDQQLVLDWKNSPMGEKL
tara:strand:+ start:147 stop:359 length:213 start_codon:yes stop_codon:yes gene_type:complete